MNISKYTFKFSVDEGKQVLLYSPLSGAMDIVDKESLTLLDSLGRSRNEEKIAEQSLAYLYERGYAYQSSRDEEAAFLQGFEEFKEKERRSNLRFVILPTYQCNSRCSYCFIGNAIGQEELMDDETVDRAFVAMDKIVSERGKDRTIQLSLFGGEPLIDTPAQRRLVERILEKGAKQGYLIDVVSNGFDLFHYISLLRKYDVSKVQVTFDGMREYHNQRRNAVDGRGPSFDRIVAGVDAALLAGQPINVRILLDRNSIRALPQLVAFFKDRHWFDNPNFSVHLGSVFDCFRCQPKEETVKHLTVREGNEALLDLCNKDRSIADLLAIDWQGVRRFLYTGKLFPPTYKTCFGGNRWFAFDLFGGIYACETTAGRPEYQIGSFSPEFALNRDLIKALEERNILNIPACKKCPQALLCAGGCTFNAVVTHGSVLAPGCRMLKETVQYGFDYYWPEIKERIQSASDAQEAASSRKPQGCYPPSLERVQSFYAEAAQIGKPSLCCPTKYSSELVSHIPQEVLEKSYGCGSPVLEANLLSNEIVVDMGCGMGIDAFLAARFVGRNGRVIGVDMMNEMIEQAQFHAHSVAERLGYDVVEFCLGEMENVPIEDSIADVVISNCVLNLSLSKQSALRQIFRILKPGGRFVISDVVADKPIPPEIRNNTELWNQCISGAVTPHEFVNYARDANFGGLNIAFEEFWKEIDGIRFHTAILKGYKLRKSEQCNYQGQMAIYLGPFSSVSDDAGHTYTRGIPMEVCTDTADALRHEPYASMFFLLDPQELSNSSPCWSGGATQCCST